MEGFGRKRCAFKRLMSNPPASKVSRGSLNLVESDKELGGENVENVYCTSNASKRQKLVPVVDLTSESSATTRYAGSQALGSKHEFFLSHKERRERLAKCERQRQSEASDALKREMHHRNKEFTRVIAKVGEPKSEAGELFFNRKAAQKYGHAQEVKSLECSDSRLLKAPFPTEATTSVRWRTLRLHAPHCHTKLQLRQRLSGETVSEDFKFSGLIATEAGVSPKGLGPCHIADPELVQRLFASTFGESAGQEANRSLFPTLLPEFERLTSWLASWSPLDNAGRRKGGKRVQLNAGYDPESLALMDELQGLIRKPNEANAYLLENSWRQVCLVEQSTPFKPLIDLSPCQHLIIEGPSGSGKTYLAHHASKACGYHVFELNASSRRSARDVNQLFKEAASTHWVNIDEPSLLLIDDIDIVLDGDRGFIPSLVELLEQSRRPIVMTCANNPFSRAGANPFPRLNVIRASLPTTLELSVKLFFLLLERNVYCNSRQELDAFVTEFKCDWRQIARQVDFWVQLNNGKQIQPFSLFKILASQKTLESKKLDGELGDRCELSKISEMADNKSFCHSEPFNNALFEFHYKETLSPLSQDCADVSPFKSIRKDEMEALMYSNKCERYFPVELTSDSDREASGGASCDSFRAETFCYTFDYDAFQKDYRKLGCFSGMKLQDDTEANSDTLKTAYNLLLSNYTLGQSMVRIGTWNSISFAAEVLPFLRLILKSNGNILKSPQQGDFLYLQVANGHGSKGALTRRRKDALSVKRVHFPSLFEKERDFLIWLPR